jgi:hypothetical protein
MIGTPSKKSRRSLKDQFLRCGAASTSIYPPDESPATRQLLIGKQLGAGRSRLGKISTDNSALIY